MGLVDYLINVAGPGRELMWVILKGFVVMPAGLAIHRALQKRPAALRHSLLFWLLMSMALLPFFSLLLPNLAVEIPGIVEEAQVVPLGPGPTPRGVETLLTPGPVLPVEIDSIERHSTDDSPRFPDLTWIWLVGTALLLSRLAVGALRARRMIGRAVVSDDPELEAVLQSVVSSLGLRKVPVYFSALPVVPMTIGIWNPALLLPAAARGWSPSRLEVVLLHELIHVRRHDLLRQFLARLICAFHWFNPLVWMAEKRLRREGEAACDDEVLCRGTRASDYARCLLSLARDLKEKRGLEMAAAAFKNSELEERIMSILDPERLRRARPTVRAIVVPAVALSLLIPLAAVTPQSEINSLTAQEDAEPQMSLAPRPQAPEPAPPPPPPPPAPGSPKLAPAPAAPPPPPPPPVPEWGSGHDELVWRENGVRWHVQMEGVRFNSGRTGIDEIRPGGFLEISRRESSGEEILRLEPGAPGILERNYQVDGEPSDPYSPEAEALLDEFLARMQQLDQEMEAARQEVERARERIERARQRIEIDVQEEVERALAELESSREEIEISREEMRAMREKLREAEEEMQEALPEALESLEELELDRELKESIRESIERSLDQIQDLELEIELPRIELERLRKELQKLRFQVTPELLDDLQQRLEELNLRLPRQPESV